MHERERRHAVRCTFILTCVAPTVLTVGFAIWMRMPSYANRWARAIGDSTGTEIRIDRVSHPEPYKTQLQQLQVLDPATRCVLMESDRLEITRTNLGLEIAGNLRLRADAASLWETVHARVLNNHLWSDSIKRVTWRCDTLEWRNDVTSQTFHDLTLDIKSNENPVAEQASYGGRNVLLTFRSLPSDADECSPATITLQRVGGGQTRTTLASRMNGQPIKPAILFPSWHPHCSESRLTGDFGAVFESGQWRGTAKNVVWNDLDGKRVIGEPFAPLRLIGTFELRDGSVEFHEGRIVSASGNMVCNSGTISSTLLARLRRAGFQVSRLSSNESMLAFQKLSFAFSMNPDGCQIEGKCDHEGSTFIDGKAFRVEPPQTAIRIDTLVAMLASPTNARTNRLIEAMRLRLPLDRLRFAERRQ